jgi:hypothetical protein
LPLRGNKNTFPWKGVLSLIMFYDYFFMCRAPGACDRVEIENAWSSTFIERDEGIKEPSLPRNCSIQNSHECKIPDALP